MIDALQNIRTQIEATEVVSKRLAAARIEHGLTEMIFMGSTEWKRDRSSSGRPEGHSGLREISMRGCDRAARLSLKAIQRDIAGAGK